MKPTAIATRPNSRPVTAATAKYSSDPATAARSPRPVARSPRVKRVPPGRSSDARQDWQITTLLTWKYVFTIGREQALHVAPALPDCCALDVEEDSATSNCRGFLPEGRLASGLITTVKTTVAA